MLCLTLNIKFKQAALTGRPVIQKEVFYYLKMSKALSKWQFVKKMQENYFFCRTFMFNVQQIDCSAGYKTRILRRNME